MNLPTKIYKYESASIQSLVNLKSQCIYFNSPEKFNDPFDCNIQMKLKELSGNELNTLRNHFIQYNNSEKYVHELNTISTTDFSKLLKKIGNDLIDDRYKNIYKTKGVSCFSETNNNLLMWSHYSSSAKGFCLEFDTKEEPFSKLLPIEYVEEPPLLDYVKMVVSEDKYLLKKILCIKSSDWAYEKEWRCFHNQVNVAYCYPKDALTGVYFGSEIDKELLEIICLILQGQNPNVKFYQGTKSRNSFNVVFEEVNYTPHIKIDK